MTFEQQLEKYAEVVVKVGLKIQHGQRLLIGAAGRKTYPVQVNIFG